MKQLFTDVGHQAAQNDDTWKRIKTKWSLWQPQLNEWREFPGHIVGRRSWGKPSSLCEWRRWSWGVQGGQGCSSLQWQSPESKNCREREPLRRTEDPDYIFSYMLIGTYVLGHDSTPGKETPKGLEETMSGAHTGPETVCVPTSRRGHQNR